MKFLSNNPTRLRQHIVFVIFLLISLFLLLLRYLYYSDGYKQFQKPLKISGMKQSRFFPGEQVGDLETYIEQSNWVVTEITFKTRMGKQYKVKDSPADGYFPDDSDGLVDSVSKMRKGYGRRYGQSSGSIYWKKIPYEENLFQVLTEKYNRALQEQMKHGDVVR